MWDEGPPPADGPPGWLDDVSPPGAEAAPAPAIVQGPPRVSERDPRELLREVFGFGDFRPLQAEIIKSVLKRRDTLAIMPTGGGKSLCYQLPALLFDGLTVVVSPLISLMQDQVRQLDDLGIPAAVLNSTLDRQTYNRQRNAVRSGQAKLLYLAPETLFKERTLSLLRQVRVSCLTIDEAHCISEWGHDFRPEYRRLTEIRATFPDAVCIGLTATATIRVRDDIANSLGFEQDARYVASFDRKNLMLRVREKDGPTAQLLEFVGQHGGRSGIIYCATRKTVESVAERLNKRGLNARPYHAGLPENVRRENQERFIRDDVDIIVATVAFGMGIDKPDVRFVAHHDLPKSIESYYQEIGRGGRDGLESECLLLYSPADRAKIEFFISQKAESEQRVARTQLSHMQAFAETTLCRRRPLLDYFGEEYGEAGCGACDNCVDGVELVDLTVAAQKFLSCIYRTGQRYGASHIVDVLRGSESQKVVRAGHDQLSTYGIGKDMTSAQWRHIGRQLLQHGFVLADSNFGGLVLTGEATPLLRGKAKFSGKMPAKAKKARRSRNSWGDPSGSGSGRRGDSGGEGPANFDTKLFQVLRTLRKQVADERNVPPYVVFSDRTLMEMADALPHDNVSLKALHGVGDVKIRKHGRRFLDAISVYRFGHPLPDRPEPAAEPVPAPQTGDSPTRIRPTTSERTVRREKLVHGIRSGHSIGEMATREGIQTKTAVAHLEAWLDQGGAMDVAYLREALGLEKALIDQCLAEFHVHKSGRLKPVFEAMGGDVDYDTLRLARLVWLAEVSD